MIGGGRAVRKFLPTLPIEHATEQSEVRLVVLEPISKLLRTSISCPGGARDPHLFPHKLRSLRSSEHELEPLMTF
jgi:hypothetical protein